MISEWRDNEMLLITRLSGPVNMEQVETWKEGLYKAGWNIPEHGRFRMLVDIRGYEVADIDPEVHKVQRMVIPTFLAEHNFRVAFFDLFEDAADIEVEKRSATCISVAHVHHDCNKMELYASKLGRPHENFFCDIEEAQRWLSGP